MRKIHHPLSLVITSLIILYMIGWFYFANEIKTQLIKNFNNKDQSLEVSFDQIKLGGFPFNFKIEIDKPHIILKQDKANIEINGDYINAETNILGKKFKFSLGLAYHIQSLGENKFAYNLEAQKGTELVITAKSYNIFQLLKDLKSNHNITTHIPRDISQFLTKISEINYELKGLKVTDSASNKLYLNIDASSNNVKEVISKTHNKITLISKTIAEGIEYINGKYTNMANLELNIDTSNNANLLNSKKLDLLVKEISFSSNNTNVKMSGNLTSEHNSLLPIGELKVSISQCDNLIDLLIRMKLITNQDSTKKLLIRLASNNDSSKYLSFSISRKSNEEIKIGNVTLKSLLQEYLHQPPLSNK